MQMNYLAYDDQGNVGQSIPFIQGETRLITVLLFNPDGTPFIYPGGTPSELLLKIFSQINAPSIQKTLSGSLVTLATASGALTGVFGFQFKLAAADTALMAANNSGLPMAAIFTDSSANKLEIDFSGIFNVSVPVVQT